MSQVNELENNAIAFLQQHLAVKVQGLSAVSGGYISVAFRANTVSGETFFIKGLTESSRTFEREAYGLQLLGEYFRAPTVMASSPHFLVLEWIDSGSPAAHSYCDFGKKLASMHRNGWAPHSLPGFPFDNTIGATLQKNVNKDYGWPDFFWSLRLEPQLLWAIEKGFSFTTSDLNKLRETCLKLLGQIDEPCFSLLHGDLWGGNHKFTLEGEPWLFDPSCYYGHREAELAMMRLFSGFPAEVFESYQKDFPLESDWEKRVELYQLYHVLNHVNLFGASYYNQAKEIINRLT